MSTSCNALVLSYDHDRQQVTALEAAPRILIAVEILGAIREGRESWVPGCTVTGDLLRINATNGVWVYRIGEQIPEEHAFVAEWPD